LKEQLTQRPCSHREDDAYAIERGLMWLEHKKLGEQDRDQKALPSWNFEYFGFALSIIGAVES
jgi:hypothetical protein